MSETTDTLTPSTPTDASSAGGATAAPEPVDTTGVDTVPTTEVENQGTDASTTEPGESGDGRAEFEALSQGLTPEQAREQAAEQSPEQPSETPETPAEQSPEQPSETPETPTDKPALDPQAEALVKRWHFDPAKIAALPEDIRSNLVAELKARNDFIDAKLREVAEAKKGEKPADAEPEAKAPGKTDEVEAKLLKDLDAYFGEDAAKAVLAAAKSLVAPLQQQAQQAQAVAVANHYREQTRQGFEAAKAVAPPGVLDKAETKSRIEAEAMRILQEDAHLHGGFDPTRLDLADAIPQAVARLYPVDTRKAAVQQIAQRGRDAVNRSVSRTPAPGRNPPPSPDEEADEAGRKAFEMLSKPKPPSPEQVRQAIGV